MSKEPEETEEFEKNHLVEHFTDDLEKVFFGNMDNFSDLILKLMKKITVYVDSNDFIRKFKIEFLKELMVMLKKKEINHRDFNLEFMLDEIWQPLKRVILGIRIEELKTSKVLKDGKKYDISGLRATYLGDWILVKLGFGKRKFKLTEEEYNKVLSQIRKLKFDVPITVEPTTTEKFFTD